MTDITATAGTVPPRAGFQRLLKNNRDTFVVWLILFVLLVIASLTSDRFLTPFNLERVAAQLTTLALISIGQTFVLLTAGIDLSVGSIISFAGTLIVAVLNNSPGSWALGIAIALIAGSLVGLVNGIAVTRFRVSPFMVTLATLSIVQGMALIVSSNFKGTLPREFGAIFTGNIGPIPTPVILVVASALIAALILRQTTFGRHVYAIGSNEAATRLSGMSTDRVKLMVYVISGFMAGLAGAYNSARTLSGDPLIGESLAFESITAVVLGGISLFGGRGSIYGTMAGVLIIAILSNLLNLLRVPSDYQYILRGALLVLAVMIYSRRSRGT